MKIEANEITIKADNKAIKKTQNELKTFRVLPLTFFNHTRL